MCISYMTQGKQSTVSRLHTTHNATSRCYATSYALLIQVIAKYTGWKGNKCHYYNCDYLCYKEPKSPYNFFLIQV